MSRAAHSIQAFIFPFLSLFQKLIYRLPDVGLHRSVGIVRKFLQGSDLPRQQIGRVAVYNLLGSHGAILPEAVGISIADLRCNGSE